MVTVTPGSLALYAAKQTDKRADANREVLGSLDPVMELIELNRGAPENVRLGIQTAILSAVAVAAALSMIPFESNFASEFAGRMLRDLAAPGMNMAINAPIYDYLEDLFPTASLNPRQLVQGIESGALTERDLIESAVDGGLKDVEIQKLVKMARVMKFEKDTKDAFAMLDRYADALIAAQLANARLDVDEAITMRQAAIERLRPEAQAEAMELKAE